MQCLHADGRIVLAARRAQHVLHSTAASQPVTAACRARRTNGCLPMRTRRPLNRGCPRESSTASGLASPPVALFADAPDAPLYNWFPDHDTSASGGQHALACGHRLTCKQCLPIFACTTAIMRRTSHTPGLLWGLLVKLDKKRLAILARRALALWRGGLYAASPSGHCCACSLSWASRQKLVASLASWNT